MVSAFLEPRLTAAHMAAAFFSIAVDLKRGLLSCLTKNCSSFSLRCFAGPLTDHMAQKRCLSSVPLRFEFLVVVRDDVLVLCY